ncbi:hypothetical protein [Mycobacterium avium]|uniref:hypothetical protein n=1 Tax=Mycobacterium avium TaxID=1764 RepID=UPI000A9ABA5D|nr:hypothetical protein [Mycobacterium avium]
MSDAFSAAAMMVRGADAVLARARVADRDDVVNEVGDRDGGRPPGARKGAVWGDDVDGLTMPVARSPRRQGGLGVGRAQGHMRVRARPQRG